MTALLAVTPFKGIDPRELDRIEAMSRILEPRDGIPIFAEGDEADAVYAVIGGTGHVRIGATDRGSKGLMIELFGPGGEAWRRVAVRTVGVPARMIFTCKRAGRTNPAAARTICAGAFRHVPLCRRAWRKARKLFGV